MPTFKVTSSSPEATDGPFSKKVILLEISSSKRKATEEERRKYLAHSDNWLFSNQITLHVLSIEPFLYEGAMSIKKWEAIGGDDYRIDHFWVTFFEKYACLHHSFGELNQTKVWDLSAHVYDYQPGSQGTGCPLRIPEKITEELVWTVTKTVTRPLVISDRFVGRADNHAFPAFVDFDGQLKYFLVDSDDPQRHYGVSRGSRVNIGKLISKQAGPIQGDLSTYCPQYNTHSGEVVHLNASYRAFKSRSNVVLIKDFQNWNAKEVSTVDVGEHSFYLGGFGSGSLYVLTSNEIRRIDF